VNRPVATGNNLVLSRSLQSSNVGDLVLGKHRTILAEVVWLLREARM